MAGSITRENPTTSVSPSWSPIHFYSFPPFTSVLFSGTSICTPLPSHRFLLRLILVLAVSGLSIVALLHSTQNLVPSPLPVHLSSLNDSLNLVSQSATSSETNEIEKPPRSLDSVMMPLPAHVQNLVPAPFSVHLCSLNDSLNLVSQSATSSETNEIEKPPRLLDSVMMPLPAHVITGNASQEERDFWKQPDGEDYQPCLDFSPGYRKASAYISKERRKFLMVVVVGGLNQQRNQIVDAVVIARILEAALVVPVLELNFIWEDESEFADIFDIEHFKRILREDVRVVSSLPSALLTPRRSEGRLPADMSPAWIRSRFLKQLNKDGVLILRGLEARLSKNLPPDLLKLRCKVAFHAIRFAPPILELGNRLARRVWIDGPYIALHLRLEKDVWVRTGCPTGLGPKYDTLISKYRISQPQYLTDTLNLSPRERRLAGRCPRSAHEMARLLKALGAPTSARIFIAGGEPFGGSKALQPLAATFPNIISMEMIAQRGELLPFQNRSSILAALDYIICLNSDIFIPSFGGNMERVMEGHRAYVGHRKYIRPNGRAIVALLEDRSITDADLGRLIRKVHRNSQGSPKNRTKKHQDVIAYPVPECMCKSVGGDFLAS